MLQTISLKPFIRVIILSLILAFLIIYLGIQYHWGDYFKATPETVSELSIPKKAVNISDEINAIKQEKTASRTFEPQIIDTYQSNDALARMTKEQINQYCADLLSKEISDPFTLELATVNCVVSNYEETFQNIESHAKVNSQKHSTITKQCEMSYLNIPHYSKIEKQLLIGICVSDQMNTSN